MTLQLESPLQLSKHSLRVSRAVSFPECWEESWVLLVLGAVHVSFCSIFQVISLASLWPFYCSQCYPFALARRGFPPLNTHVVKLLPAPNYPVQTPHCRILYPKRRLFLSYIICLQVQNIRTWIVVTVFFVGTKIYVNHSVLSCVAWR